MRTIFVALSLAFALGAAAQEFPSAKPIRIIVPYPPGGQADTIARIVCQYMSPLINQQCVIENKPGAGGIPGTEFVVRAPADGYTLLIADAGQWAIAPAMLAKPPYDPVKDLAPVGLVTTSSMFIAVHPSVAANSIQELIALAKAKPGALQYGSSGNATVHHLAMETFKSTFNLDLPHVPYRGAGQSVPALVSGQVPVLVAGLTNLASYWKAGQVRIIAATTRKRTPLAPEITGMDEIGAKEVDFPGELAIFAPAGTPQGAIEKLSSALQAAVKNPEFNKRTNAVGIEAAPSTPAELAAIIQSDQQKYRRAIKLSGAKVE